MSGAQAFWDAAAPMISETEKHPFLVAMVDGSLAQENFQYYVIQDAMYLQDFATCLRLLSKTATTTENAQALEAFAKGAEEAELALHNSFFQQWKISCDPTKERQMPNCLLYTSYILRVVTTQSHAHGLAVLLPCFWVYMHVGKCMLKLREDLGDSVERPPQFDAWIDMYGGEDFEKEVKKYIYLVDEACSTADEKTLKEMEECFMVCCKLEHMFWDQAHSLMKWPVVGGI